MSLLVEVYVVYKIKPYHSNLPIITIFYEKKSAYKFIISEVEYLLEEQSKNISGLNGDKNKHIQKYKEFLKTNNELYYYGEYLDYYLHNELEPYEIKYKIESKIIQTY